MKSGGRGLCASRIDSNQSIFPLFITSIPHKLKFLTPTVDPPSPISQVMLMYEPNWTTISVCFDQHMSQCQCYFSYHHLILFLSPFFATPLCLTKVHVRNYVLLRYIAGFIVCWLHTHPTNPMLYEIHPTRVHRTRRCQGRITHVGRRFAV